MPQSLQVRCVTKPDRYNPHERISHIGGDGWKITQREAITYIEAGQYAFYVSVGGHISYVIVALHNGNKYIKTTADGDQPNNLLSLPECK